MSHGLNGSVPLTHAYWYMRGWLLLARKQNEAFIFPVLILSLQVKKARATRIVGTDSDLIQTSQV